MSEPGRTGEEDRPRLGHVPFPPFSGFLLLPTSSGASFRAGLGLWSACRPMGRMFRAAAHLLAGYVGAGPWKALGSGDSRLPVHPSVWEEMLRTWTSWFGPIDEFAFYSPRQEERSGFAVLLIGKGQGVGFVKVRPGYDFAQEASLLEALSAAHLFQVPRPVGVSEMEGWAMLGMSALGGGRHSPRLRSSPRALIAELSDLLGGVLARTDQVPQHWLPMHGDLGPWNLRRVKGAQPAIFDLEHCTYGPPGADLVFHSAACTAMRIGTAENVEEYGEAVDYWRREIPRRFGGQSADQALRDDMLAVLERWRR